MKLSLSRATKIDPAANTCSTVNKLAIFVNAAEDYAAVISILQKGIEAVQAALKADPKTHLHRIEVVLSEDQNTAPKPVAAAITQAKKVEHELKAIAKEEDRLKKPFVIKKKTPKTADAEAQLQELHDLTLQAEAEKQLIAELEWKKAELALLHAKLNRE